MILTPQQISTLHDLSIVAGGPISINVIEFGSSTADLLAFRTVDGRPEARFMWAEGGSAEADFDWASRQLSNSI